MMADWYWQYFWYQPLTNHMTEAYESESAKLDNDNPNYFEALSGEKLQELIQVYRHRY